MLSLRAEVLTLRLVGAEVPKAQKGFGELCNPRIREGPKSRKSGRPVGGRASSFRQIAESLIDLPHRVSTERRDHGTARPGRYLLDMGDAAHAGGTSQ